MVATSHSVEIRHSSNDLLLFDHLLDLSSVPDFDIFGGPVSYAKFHEQEFLKHLSKSQTLYADSKLSSISTCSSPPCNDTPYISESRFKEFFPTNAAYIWVSLALAGKNVVVTNTGPEDSIKLANQLHYQAALDECVVKLGPDTLTKVGTITFI